MKEQIIQIPDTLEVKEIKDGKIILVKDGETHYYIDSGAQINTIVNREFTYTCKNNATSRKQLEKLLAINMLMNVAKYRNDGWQPDWSKEEEGKYYIQIENVSKNLGIDCTGLFNSAIVYFKSEELAEQAIEILGEETIKLALSTDY